VKATLDTGTFEYNKAPAGLSPEKTRRPKASGRQGAERFAEIGVRESKKAVESRALLNCLPCSAFCSAAYFLTGFASTELRAK
jgi:hypothetical protein